VHRPDNFHRFLIYVSFWFVFNKCNKKIFIIVILHKKRVNLVMKLIHI